MRPRHSRMVSAVSEIDDLLHAASLAASGSPASARAAIDALPWLTASIAADRAAGAFSVWGRSTVVDENTAEPVLSPALFDELHRQAGITAAWPVGNAGLLHCYGYLLSLAETPYGAKRDRWLEPALALACGREAAAFAPWASGATLLERATTSASALLDHGRERLDLVVDARPARVALTTASGPGALAYAVAPTPHDEPLLVTMFPVSDAAAIRAEADTTDRLRWNAA